MKLKKIVASLLILSFILPQSVFCADVLQNTGQRQTVIERTKQYSSGLNDTKIRTEAALDFKKDIKVHTNTNVTGQKGNCGGYTTSSCGIACCGQQECQSVCKANRTTVHGHDTCLEAVNTSWCGMSCCGADDCNRVCFNYRTSTASVGNCGGYIKTATGASCCGYEDCRKKSCGGYTSTVHVDTGTEMQCCGATNCNNVKCDFNHSTEVISGGTTSCCGIKDCYSKYCEGQTSTVPVSGANKGKTVECCGGSNCYNVKCDGYTRTNTPAGPMSCCGYEDCRNKECEYKTTAVNQKGQTVSCCGILECNNIIDERTYQEPKQECDVKKTTEEYIYTSRTQCGANPLKAVCDSSGCTFTCKGEKTLYTESCCSYKEEKRIIWGNSTPPNASCQLLAIEGGTIPYYKFECIVSVASEGCTAKKPTTECIIDCSGATGCRCK